MSNEIRIFCEAAALEQLELLKTLAAIPAPSHSEDERAAFIADWLRQAGLSPVIDGAKNVLVPLFEGEAKGITVFMAHTDVVFPDRTPLPVRQEGELLFAPGVGDDTANAVALMLAARYFAKRAPKEPVLIAFNSCEEGFGNLKGVREIMKTYAGRVKQLISFDCDYRTLVNGAVGSERWKVEAHTRGGHSYSDFGRKNAIEVLAELIGKLYAQPVPDIPGTHTTYNVGTISGGTSINTIAQAAEMTYEYRSDDYGCLAAMREQFRALADEVDSPEGELTLTLMGERPCGANVPEEEMAALISRCAAAVEQVTGDVPGLAFASTDANIPLSLGVPAVTFGLYLGDGAHTREEYVEIPSLNVGLEIALTLMGEWFA